MSFLTALNFTIRQERTGTKYHGTTMTLLYLTAWPDTFNYRSPPPPAVWFDGSFQIASGIRPFSCLYLSVEAVSCRHVKVKPKRWGSAGKQHRTALHPPPPMSPAFLRLVPGTSFSERFVRSQFQLLANPGICDDDACVVMPSNSSLPFRHVNLSPIGPANQST